MLRRSEDFFIWRFVKLSGFHYTWGLYEASLYVNILVILKSVTRTIAALLLNVTNLKMFVLWAVHAAFLKYLATVALARLLPYLVARIVKSQTFTLNSPAILKS